MQCCAILLSPQCDDTTSCIRQATLINYTGKTYIMLNQEMFMQRCAIQHFVSERLLF